MALSGVQRNAMRMPAGTNIKVDVEVATEDSLHMMDRVWRTLTGPSLEIWLRTRVHPYFERAIVNRFAYQGDRQVGHWPDLSDATEAIREGLGFAGDWPINIRTEEMFETVTKEADFYASGWSAEMILPGSAATGTVAEKIKTAQEGKPTPNPMSANFGPTPARPVLAADETDLAILTDALSDYIMLGVVRSFR